MALLGLNHAVARDGNADSIDPHVTGAVEALAHRSSKHVITLHQNSYGLGPSYGFVDRLLMIFVRSARLTIDGASLVAKLCVHESRLGGFMSFEGMTRLDELIEEDRVREAKVLASNPKTSEHGDLRE